jgi:hypothetical protein
MVISTSFRVEWVVHARSSNALSSFYRPADLARVLARPHRVTRIGPKRASRAANKASNDKTTTYEEVGRQASHSRFPYGPLEERARRPERSLFDLSG